MSLDKYAMLNTNRQGLFLEKDEKDRQCHRRTVPLTIRRSSSPSPRRGAHRGQHGANRFHAIQINQARLQDRSNSTRPPNTAWNGPEKPKSRKRPNLPIQRRERPSFPAQLGGRIPARQTKSTLEGPNKGNPCFA